MGYGRDVYHSQIRLLKPIFGNYRNFSKYQYALMENDLKRYISDLVKQHWL